MPEGGADAEALYAPPSPSSLYEGGAEYNPSIHRSGFGGIGDDDANTNTYTPPHAPTDEISYCTVIEVLKDETPNLSGEVHRKEEKLAGKVGLGAREQRWTAVQIERGSDGVVALGLKEVFELSGGMRGLGLERERRGGDGGGNENGGGIGNGNGGGSVGNIAKIYGFGGRRV